MKPNKPFRRYGLYGSSQFLSDHGVRVVAVGVGKDVSYDFLQSVGSQKSPENVFSYNPDRLPQAAPFVYRDICNRKLVIENRIR